MTHSLFTLLGTFISISCYFPFMSSREQDIVEPMCTTLYYTPLCTTHHCVLHTIVYYTVLHTIVYYTVPVDYLPPLHNIPLFQTYLLCSSEISVFVAFLVSRISFFLVTFFNTLILRSFSSECTPTRGSN